MTEHRDPWKQSSITFPPGTWRRLDAWRGPFTRREAIQMLIQHASENFIPMRPTVDTDGHWYLPDRPVNR